MKFQLTIAFLSATLFAASAAAAQPTLLRQVDAWGVYSYRSAKGEACYALTVPRAKRPTNVDHGDVFFMLARGRRPEAGYQPEAVMGYRLKRGSKVRVIVDGGDAFTMFADGRRAWLGRRSQQPRLPKAMRGGRQMKVKAVSARGTRTSYTSSLFGVTAALKRIGKCG